MWLAASSAMDMTSRSRCVLLTPRHGVGSPSSTSAPTRSSRALNGNLSTDAHRRSFPTRTQGLKPYVTSGQATSSCHGGSSAEIFEKPSLE